MSRHDILLLSIPRVSIPHQILRAKFERNVPIDVEVATRRNLKIIFLESRECLLSKVYSSSEYAAILRNPGTRFAMQSMAVREHWDKQCRVLYKWRTRGKRRKRERERERNDWTIPVDCIRTGCESTRLCLYVRCYCSFRRLIMHRNCSSVRCVISAAFISFFRDGECRYEPTYIRFRSFLKNVTAFI